MATSAVSSSTSTTATPTSSAATAATAAAANKANAQKIMTSMSAGSGVDVTSLAQNLVNAEKLPKQTELNTKISKNEARVSGYSAVMFMMTELNKSFTALKDRNNFNALSASNSNTSAFDVVAGESAATGHHDVEVTRLAKAQRTVSAGVASATAQLNGGKAMSLSIKVGDASAVTRAVTTRQGVAVATESASVTFQDLTANQTVTVGGLTLTAPQAMTASEVAAAFANPASLPNSFSGTLNGFAAAATATSGSLVFTSTTANTNVPNLAVSSSAATAPTVVTSDGIATAVTERTSVTFKDMLPGESITVGGLKYTATIATSAAQLATAFSGLQAGGATPTNPLTGTFTGTLTGFNAGVTDGSGTLAFTSTTAGSNVSDLPIFGSSAEIALADGKDTPQGIVDAINASKVGVTAQLVNTGDGSATPYQIILSGPVGLTGAFSISPSYGVGSGTPGLVFPAGLAANQAATDALVKVDGISYTRSSNSLTDVVPGLTLNLKATTNGIASVDLTRDNAALKEKFAALVTAYNDADNILTEVSNPKSTLDTYGATLVGDSTVRSLRQQLRAMVSGISSTPGDNIKSLAQMGLNVDQKGVMSLDDAKLQSALTDHYSDVVKSFTGGYNNLGTYSTLSAGFAGDAVKKITNIIGSKGALTTNTATANSQNTKYKADLEKLDTRMTSLLARYTKQFGAMDSLVGQINSQKTSLKSSFDGLMAMYTKA
ncbi:MAG: Flagellar hook-associated protein 2 [Pseudomonadota bacterium]